MSQSHVSLALQSMSKRKMVVGLVVAVWVEIFDRGSESL